MSPRLDLGTQDGQIAAFAAVAGKKMAVVVVTPGAILTPWRDSVAAVLTPMMPGQQYGAAIASVLFGARGRGARVTGGACNGRRANVMYARGLVK